MSVHSDFVSRHVGPSSSEQAHMLKALGLESLDALLDSVVPASIRHYEALQLEEGVDEATALAELAELAARNVVKRSLIGQGYHDCHTPAVILRNVLENPSWYTAYTPYQPEIAQGRLEVLFNFQTMIAELTELPIANASLLDEATAAAEAMAMAHRSLRGKRSTLLVAQDCHPQTLDVLATRAEPLRIRIEVLPIEELAAMLGAADDTGGDVFGVILQYPGTTGQIPDKAMVRQVADAAKAKGALLIAAADLLSLTLLEPPGRWGADIVIGSAQRFGVPMGFGGPHAAYMATTDVHKRSLPGRLVGQSLTADAQAAYRLALQTREQHIRREKATSNICTAQALLAIVATLYACHHGPEGLRGIARRVRQLTDTLRATLEAEKDAQTSLEVLTSSSFDTLMLHVGDSSAVIDRLQLAGFNAREHDSAQVIVSLDETTTANEVARIASAILDRQVTESNLTAGESREVSDDRQPSYLSQACFNQYRSETRMMRYLRMLADKDIALDRAMIPLGSCTMKLNAAAEMAPISWPGFARMHPYAPSDQTSGYREMIRQLENMLCACTGYDALSLQPNAGSQGEYAGLLAIRQYHDSRGDQDRDVCLIPSSAHGTNPASAQMAGMRVVVTACDENGNVDLDDLDAKLAKHQGRVAAIMITYPSTHGVFEAGVRDVCQRVHDAGGQVYIDGANLNAMVGTAQPGQFGGDVSHLNLHKTFCIPHGGGGPGVGPIGVGAHLARFLPGHRALGNSKGVVSAAPWGSALILPITWMYIRMMGGSGLLNATSVAILNANYIAQRLGEVYPILYKGSQGRVAHECILDTRKLKSEAGITVDDITKRLMDFGFHAPTMSFPVAGTLMVEPTESESLAEIDRFCDAMLAIHAEAKQVASGEWPADDNPLVNAPHTARTVTADEWTHPYTREQAAYPAGSSEDVPKYWPPVRRIDNVYGDKHLICSCPPLEHYEASADTGEVPSRVA